VDETLLIETAHYVALRRLQNAYADVVTRRAWAELGELFLPEAVVEVDTRAGAPIRLEGPTAVGDFIGTAISGFAFFEFVILSSRVEIAPAGDPTRANGRTYMSELRLETDSGRFTQAFGVYHDRYRLADARWWFEGRRYHSLARTNRGEGADLEVFEFPHHLRLDDL
jgi:hypothetical protein